MEFPWPSTAGANEKRARRKHRRKAEFLCSKRHLSKDQQGETGGFPVGGSMWGPHGGDFMVYLMVTYC